MLAACREPDVAGQPGPAPRPGHRRPRPRRPRQADVPHGPGHRELRRVGGAAHRRVDGQARRGHRPGRPRARPRRGRLRVGSRVRRTCRSSTAMARRAASASSSSTSSEQAGHPVIRDRARRPDRHRRRDGPLGGRDGVRRRGPGHRPVRPAERRGGQGAHAARARRRRPGGRGGPTRPTPTTAGSGSAPTTVQSLADAPAPDAPGARRPELPRDPGVHRAVARGRCRDRAASAPPWRATGCATTAGYGPRFLHSTGQLHKGGPPTGVFLQLTSDHPVDRPIPGWPYTFGRLIDAQARGDREALRAHDRPVVHVHLGAEPAADLGDPRAGGGGARSA